jgi:hypothetical protein
MVLLLVASALATQAVAPYLERGGLTAVASAMLLLSIASLSFVVRYPAARCEGALKEHPRARGPSAVSRQGRDAHAQPPRTRGGSARLL